MNKGIKVTLASAVLVVGLLLIGNSSKANIDHQQEPRPIKNSPAILVVPSDLSGPLDADLQGSEHIQPVDWEGREDDLNSQGVSPVVVIEDPYRLQSITVLINKQYRLPSEYYPLDLVNAEVTFAPQVMAEKKMLRREAAEALAILMNAAEQAQITLYAVSGFRSYQTQSQIYNYKVSVAGPEQASKYVAQPGHSEHQTGLAMDVTNAQGLNKSLSPSFGDSPEGLWLKDNAALYGFIIRYPVGREEVTGYNYEPWHIRYVGHSAAEIIQREGLTLEEYIARGN